MKSKRQILATATSLLILANAAQAAIVTTFYVDTAGVGTAANSDFYIASNATTTLIDGTQLLVGNPALNNTSAPKHRAYLKFDLSGLLDNGEVTSATFRIYRNVVGNEDLYGDATLYERTAVFVAGGSSDYAELTGTSLGVITSGNLATAQYFEVDVTDVVESWRLSNLASNYGFAIQGNEGANNSTAKYFQSSTGANVPQLLVTQIPEPSMIGMLGLGAFTTILLRRRARS